jgi:thymidylate synthase
MNTASRVWLRNLERVVLDGKAHAPRQQGTQEVLGYSSMIDMRFPVMTVKERKLSFQFMAAEALWILNGDDRVSSIAPYAPSIAKFSDDGERFFGAYGPRVMNQIYGVIEKLAQDQSTRQAVLTTWRQNPPASKDIPCTISAQWLIRDGKIHCIDTMRSSDLWLGWPYDVFNFTSITMFIALSLLWKCNLRLSLGNLWLQAGSQHLYDRDFKRAQQCLTFTDSIQYKAFDLQWFRDAHEFLDFLASMRETGIFGTAQ